VSCFRGQVRAIKALIHRNGPWLIWFYPDPGQWLDNWLECLGFISAFNCLDGSIRFDFNPYLFAIFPIDPRKAAPPAPPAAAVPAATPRQADDSASTPPTPPDGVYL
jgi:hypothetical protein